MTFPAVSTIGNSVTDPASTTHTIALNGSASAGDLLLGWLQASAAHGGGSPPSGWTELIDTAARYFLDKVFAAGGETDAAVTLTNSVQSTHNSYRITGAQGAVESTFAAALDPGNLTPSWGANDTLWLAFITLVTTGAGDITAAPSGYSGLTKTAEIDIGGGLRQRGATAWKQANAASENPGTFTVSGTSPNGVSLTVGIRPAVDAAQAATKMYNYRRRRTG